MYEGVVGGSHSGDPRFWCPGMWHHVVW